MKKTFLFSAFIFLTAISADAQTASNTYPSSGNVGIGTMSPAAKLDVVGDLFVGNQLGGIGGLYIGQAGYQASLLYDNGSGNLHITPRSGYSTIFTAGSVGIGTTTPNAGFLLDVNGLGAVGTQGSARLYMGTTSATGAFIQARDNSVHQHLDFYAGSYDFNFGNVGIAADAPVSLFQVDDGCTKASIGDASGSSVLNWGTSYLGFNASRSGTNWLTNGDGGNNGGGVMYSSIFGDMYFSIIPSTGGSSQVLADANVANNIALKISHTDCAIYAKKIFVQLTGFPDYVFKKDYKLMPLSQVKSYIEQNQHLPGLPTDKEVESKGLDVGEMNKLLTKKVEELTLYLIQQKEETDKQNKLQQQSIDELKKQVEALSRH